MCWNHSWGNYWITDTSQSSQDKVSKGCTSTWPPAKLRECHGHGTSEWMPWRRCQNWRGRRALKIDELKWACQLNCAGAGPSSCQPNGNKWKAKAANALFLKWKRHTEWFRLDPSLFARKSWVLKAWTPSAPSGLQGSKAHSCPESVVRGFVPHTFLNMEKKT